MFEKRNSSLNNQFVPIFFNYHFSVYKYMGKISSEVSMNKYSLLKLSLNFNLNSRICVF